MCVNVISPEIHFLPVQMNGKMMLWIICHRKILKSNTYFYALRSLFDLFLTQTTIFDAFFDNRIIPK